MPLYDYYCPVCGRELEDVRRSIENRDGAGILCECGNVGMNLKLASPSFKIDDSFREKLNKNYDKHKERVKAGLAKPNSIDRKKGNIG